MNKSKDELKNCHSQFMLHNRLNYILTIILQIIVVALNISLAYFIMKIIDSMEKADVKLFTNTLVYMIFAVAAFLLFSMLLKYYKNMYMKRAISQFKGYIFDKILNKSIGDFNSTLTGKIINSFSNDLNLIETNYLNGGIMIIYYVFMFFIAITAMRFINITITMCVAVACIVPILFSMVFGRRLIKKEKDTSDENESFVDQMKDLLNGFFVIKSFKAEKEVLGLFSEQNFSLEETKRSRRETSDVMLMISQLSTTFVVAIIFILGVYYTFKGRMTIATVIACIQLSNYVTEPIKQLVPLLSNRKATMSLIDKVADIIKEDEAVMDHDKVIIDKMSSEIKLKDVNLSYKNGNRILKDLNITFSRGKSYAIVGNSGCGKSTLLRLLLGYFKEYEGAVTIDSNELADIDLDSLYDIVSVVQQNVFLFDKSIKNNITMFKEFDVDTIEQAVSRAGLRELISDKGEEYKCGEGGNNLSGGEQQRISIARCLIRETPVLLMDEATAALDNATAFQVENDILSMKDLTRIIVTHKLQEAILRKYDEIIVMRDGRIEEKGHFQKLIDSRGYFYSLFNISKGHVA